MTRFGFILLAGLVWGSAAPAQTPAALPNADAVSARGTELKKQRDALESSYKQQLKQCYQEFNVTGCRNDAREKYVVAHRALSKLELDNASQERAIQAHQARQRLADRQAEAAERALEAEKAKQASVDRANHNANKQADHVPDASKRGQFDEKQRDAQERRQEVERRARERERDKPRAAPLPAPGA